MDTTGVTGNTFTASNGKIIEIKPLKFRKEKAVLKTVTEVLSTLSDDSKRLIYARLTGGGTSQDAATAGNSLFDIIKLVTAEFPDALVKIASIVTDEDINELEENYTMSDVVTIAVITGKQFATNLNLAMSSLNSMLSGGAVEEKGEAQ